MCCGRKRTRRPRKGKSRLIKRNRDPILEKENIVDPPLENLNNKAEDNNKGTE